MIRLRSYAGAVRVESDSPGIPKGPSNLARRAADILKKTTGCRRGCVIRIEKRIPVRAGLGGGSSNAATVLVGLNRLWKLGLSRKALLRLGAELGSDVPFFLLEKPFAVGRGRGEKLTAVRAGRRRFWHCVVKPPFSLSTRGVYRNFDRLTPPRPDARIIVRDPLSQPLFNSLEVAVNNRVITIRAIKDELIRRGARSALMSGSGSCVFGIFDGKAAAQKAARDLRKAHRTWRTFAVHTF